MLYTKLDLSRQ